MEAMLNDARRWCPVCECPGLPIVWGYPSEVHRQLADEDRVVLAGRVMSGMSPSHLCADCGCEFIASNRLNRRRRQDAEVFGVAVWPHGRRSVRIEANDEGWTVLVEGEGSMLIDRHAMTVFPSAIFEGMWPWEVEEWASRRGLPAAVTPDDDGWAIQVHQGGGFFELLLIKSWWRTLGRIPVESAIDQLTCELSSPVWLPESQSK